MRDRLIELLEAECGFSRYMTDDERRAKLADHLLAEGVIVPPIPVKIGDKIYRMMCYGFRDFFIREETVWIVDKHYFTGFEIITKYGSNGCSYFPKIEKDDVGKTVFLTREEAEKALTERSENDNT